jgi:DNA repair exonuclease SbcCD ATPase subunit
VEELRAQNKALSEDLQRQVATPPANGSFTGHEAASLREELAATQARAAALEREAADARADADDARAALRKVEADLEALSSAYATLDSHANDMQTQLERAELQQRLGGGAPGAGAADVEAAVAAAREEAQQEADASMDDLMVCLGQEEAKVQALAARLDALGGRSEEVIAGVLAAGGAESDDDMT